MSKKKSTEQRRLEMEENLHDPLNQFTHVTITLTGPIDPLDNVDEFARSSILDGAVKTRKRLSRMEKADIIDEFVALWIEREAAAAQRSVAQARAALADAFSELLEAQHRGGRHGRPHKLEPIIKKLWHEFQENPELYDSEAAFKKWALGQPWDTEHNRTGFSKPSLERWIARWKKEQEN